MEPETITHGAVLVMGVILGVAGTCAVVFGKSEAARQRLIDRKFWPTLERVRARTGGRIGVVEDVPAVMAAPQWMRVPDLPGSLPQPPVPDPGAWRPAREPHGAGDLSVWPVNRQGPGQHRLRGDDTQDLRVYAAAFHEPGVIAP